jgi:hypothetical protein
MTFTEYKEIIDEWNLLAKDSGLFLSNGKPLPITFWKSFLGIKRKVHQEIYNGVYRIKSNEVPTYLAKSIVFASLLSKSTFLKQVELHIPRFESDRAS